MLGLAGPYSQIMRENMPDVRGLSSIQGLTYTPGTWVEAIQLNKGTGSVVNGYESIAGQINVNLRNPANMDRLYLNSYVNQMGRLELNANLSADVGEHGVLHCCFMVKAMLSETIQMKMVSLIILSASNS